MLILVVNVITTSALAWCWWAASPEGNKPALDESIFPL